MLERLVEHGELLRSGDTVPPFVTPLDLHSQEFLEDPAPTLAWLREHDPVHRSEYGYWLLTRYDDIAAAFRDPRLSSEWSKKASLPITRRRLRPAMSTPTTRSSARSAPSCTRST